MIGVSPRPTLVALARRGVRRRALRSATSRRVAVLAHEDVGVADLVGAASLVLSQAALDALTRARRRRICAPGVATTAKAPESKGAAKAAPAKAAADAPESPDRVPAGRPRGG